MVPRGWLASSEYCLAGGGRYVVYVSEQGAMLDLTGDDRLKGWWIVPPTCPSSSTEPVAAERRHRFVSPFTEDGILYLRSTTKFTSQ